jgi:hypothetical protein
MTIMAESTEDTSRGMTLMIWQSWQLPQVAKLMINKNIFIR